MFSRGGAARRYGVWLSVPIIAVVVFLVVRRMIEVPSARNEALAEVTITEGTNFSVEASPDGRTLVMDLLGSLWTLPASGGAARRITDELLEARQPSFSPQGDRIAFQGFDLDWDLWSIKPDGSAATRLTSGPFDDREPHWSHDGTRLVFSSDRSGQYDIWILNVGSGELRRLTTNPAEDFAPSWSADDREIAFVSTRAPAGVWAVDVESSAERPMAAVTGSVSGPSWTPDGKQVLYNVVADGAARLELSGNRVAVEDVFPFRAHWLSGTEFLYTADGKIKRRSLGEQQVRTVEFTAAVPLRRTAYARKRRDFDSTTPKRALGIVRPMVSPDGERVVFAALGDVWVMEIGSKPVRLTADQFLDTEPAWSPDGSQVVFSSDRGGNMDLWIRDMKTGRDRRLTETPAAEMASTWSPDGDRIAFVSMGTGYLQDVHVIDVKTGKVTVLQQRIPTPTFPTWSPDGRTVLVGTGQRASQRFQDGFNKLLAIPVDGSQPHFLPLLPASSVIDSRVGDGPTWAPDGKKIAFVNQGLLRVAEVGIDGAPIGEPRPVTSELAHAPSWTGDSKKILYMATDQLKLLSLEDGGIEPVPLDLEFTPSMPSGRVVVHSTQVWNGRDKTLQSERDVVIEGHRIRSVEPHQQSLHTGRVIDASGLTVMPGMVDMHSHVYAESGEALGRLLLAYGVTTARDPGSTPYRSLEFREAWDSGVRPGPRFFTSGAPIDGSRVYFPQFHAVSTPTQLEMEIERNRRLGHDHFKIYIRLGNQMQKRLVEFAHQAGMPVASHDIYPAVVFGLDGVEHIGGSNKRGFAKVSAIGNTYGDVIELIARSGMTFTPTLSDDNSNGFDLIPMDDPSMMADDRVRVLMTSWAQETARTRVERLREAGAPLRAQTLARHGQTVKRLAQAGVKIVAGTDAPNIPQGVGMHAELALYVRGGLTPFEALQAATINAIEALGAGADLGTVEAGKLADLLIIEGDPLVDVKNARNIRTVIKNGQVFEMKQLLTGTVTAVGSTKQVVPER
jgi:Tol biopolymer transport system component/imidazolonepropionase-like amidohydrolase